MKKLITFSLCLATGIAFAQTSAPAAKAKDENAVKYAETITIEDLKDDLTILASDALEGRETGERGQRMAAAYIKDHFESIGLVGPVNNGRGDGYYQDVKLRSSKAGDIYVKAGGETYKNLGDVLYMGSAQNTDEINTSVVFAGNGDKAAFEKLDVKGKSVLVVITDGNRNARNEASTTAKAKGAKALYFVMHESDDKYKAFKEKYGHYFSGERLSLDTGEKKETKAGMATFYVSPYVASKIMNQSFEKIQKASSDYKAGKKSALRKIKAGKASFRLENISEPLVSENVLGYLEGSDLKDELVVITAHYDHVGIIDGKIYNGADDDGSGTVGLLEMAEAFSKAKAEGHGPRRSMLFMTVTGEEKGLLGSAYYADHPIFPLENTVVNLNIDMIGRTGDRDFETEDYVFLVGADKLSSELHELSEQANATYTKMYLDYTYNDQNHPERIYYRSDHWNFAKKGIPIIFYFNGTHDDYHQHTDEIDKINWEMLHKRTQLVYYTAWEIANRDQRLKIDKK